MTPPKPANDETPPLWPGLSPRAEVRLQWVFVIVWLTAGAAFMFAVLDAHHWIGLGITLGIATFFIFSAALWRLMVYGRA